MGKDRQRGPIPSQRGRAKVVPTAASKPRSACQRGSGLSICVCAFAIAHRSSINLTRCDPNYSPVLSLLNQRPCRGRLASVQVVPATARELMSFRSSGSNFAGPFRPCA